MDVVLFTTGCPKCKILEQKLKDQEVSYDLGDVQEIVNLGYFEAPILKIDNVYMNFTQAIEYLRERKA